MSRNRHEQAEVETDQPQTIIVGQQTFTVLFPDLLRPLTDDEYGGLQADIELRGVVVPVIVDEDLGVIDGANRLAIVSKLGRTSVPIEIRTGLSHDEKKELARSLNDNRRQMTAEDRRQLAKRMRAEGKST